MCNHQWVMYQPFSGEAYECCALAGCGITKEAYNAALQAEDAKYNIRFAKEDAYGQLVFEDATIADLPANRWWDNTGRRD